MKGNAQYIISMFVLLFTLLYATNNRYLQQPFVGNRSANCTLNSRNETVPHGWEGMDFCEEATCNDGMLTKEDELPVMPGNVTHPLLLLIFKLFFISLNFFKLT